MTPGDVKAVVDDAMWEKYDKFALISALRQDPNICWYVIAGWDWMRFLIYIFSGVHRRVVQMLFLESQLTKLKLYVMHADIKYANFKFYSRVDL